MASNRETRRLRVLKLRGTKAFSEGKISEATRQYVDAMQMEMEQELKCGTSQELSTKPDEAIGDNITKSILQSPVNTRSQDVGIHSVLRATVDDATKAIIWSPHRPKPYLSKASALILQNKWEEARNVYLEGINRCDDCLAIRSALERLDHMDHFLQMIPSILERTQRARSTSSDTSDQSTTSPTSPVPNKRKFRLQHRKKLSRPMMMQFYITSAGRIKSTDDDDDEDDDDDDDDESQDTWF